MAGKRSSGGWFTRVTIVGPILLGSVGAAHAGDNASPANGRDLYLENCASCHGINLEGQPNWKARLPSGRMPAPPHDASGHTWHHPDRVLIEITMRGPAAVVGGGYESDMPGFEDVLTLGEVGAILDYIKATWPDREREYQIQRTQADTQ